ncbi:hypothetical protein KG088_04610 [Halomonas sp. TRM85114]|uniref:hypothetical protein n=1 Tax=Halomonas jincaotanensis TaxID=2810616 RepID=UPI001BD637E9|nr:hypothetical protein [Halomonas jincaotanensis]MBS9402903.1 hypothetical protein [Halomonas jincaotanensis]
MKRAGPLALMPFLYTDLTHSKKRPVLLLRHLDHFHDDWAQGDQRIPTFSFVGA